MVRTVSLRGVAACLCFWAGLFGGQPAQACEVSIGIPGNQPFTGLNAGQVSGVIGQAAVEVLRRVGCRAEPRELPFPRMYNWVHEGRIGVATSVLRTSERERQAHYTAPVISEYTVVMVPRGRTFPIQHAADLRGKRIGGQLGFAYPPLEGTGVELRRERSYDINIRKVAEGRLDGTLIGSITGPYLARELGVAEHVEFLPLALGRVDLGLALSTEDFTAEQLAHINLEIAALRESPKWVAILDGNGIASLVHPWPLID